MDLKSIARILVRKAVLGGSGPTRVAFGPNKGLRMFGLSVSNVLSTSEPHLQRIISDHVLPGTTVLDIGANIGFFTLMLSRAVGPRGKVFAFEPIPATFAVLAANLETNAVTNVEAMNAAVSDREGELEFRVPKGGASMASYYWHKNAIDVDRIQVKAISLDKIESLTGRKIGFVKIDVEGAEGDVLRGMRQILDSSRPSIFVECSDIGRETSWSLLSERGYCCFFSNAPALAVASFDQYRHNDFLWLPR